MIHQTKQTLKSRIKETIDGDHPLIEIENAPEEKEADLAYPCFPMASVWKTSPSDVAETLKNRLEETPELIDRVYTEGPYLNFVFDDEKLALYLFQQTDFGCDQVSGEEMILEYSSPNTNKPQHVGHLRNNLLGHAISNICEHVGHDVTRVNLINDRGIHICKAMTMWMEDACQRPSEGEKGDHFVGRYYTAFEDKKHRETAKELLLKWEEGDPEIRDSWKTLRSWVLDGFRETYDRLGVKFDEVQFESELYELGKNIVAKGVERGIFEEKPDGSIVYSNGDDEKVVLRSDGSSIYITQDLGTAYQRSCGSTERVLYVVGNEQDYHFRVLFDILSEIGIDVDCEFEHLSYGMVRLPEGRMQSRDGTVIKADHLMDEVKQEAAREIEERHDLDDREKEERAEKIAQSALAFKFLSYRPQTEIEFDPRASVDFQGQTGPYCLYAYARIRSLQEKIEPIEDLSREDCAGALKTEKAYDMVRHLIKWPEIVKEASKGKNPAKVTAYLYDLSHRFSSLYNDENHRIKEIENRERKQALLFLLDSIESTMEKAFDLIGMEPVDEM